MAKTESKRRYYSPEFKRGAVQMAGTRDQPRAAVARILGIRPAMLPRWKQERQASGAAGIKLRSREYTDHVILKK